MDIGHKLGMSIKGWEWRSWYAMIHLAVVVLPGDMTEKAALGHHVQSLGN